MDDFCGSAFWDSQLTLNTTSPDLTTCFEKTVLIWVPCGFLWIFSFMDYYYSYTNILAPVPWSFINISKLILTILTIVLDLVNILQKLFWKDDNKVVYTVDLVAPGLKIATYACYLTLLVFSLRKGVVSSGVQFIFWMLIAVSQIIRFQTLIRNRSIIPFGELVVEMVYLPLVMAVLLINCCADVRPKCSNSSQKWSPEINSSYLSRMSFSWFTLIIWRGFRKPLEQKDLWDLNEDDKSGNMVPIFDKHWNKSLENANLRYKKKRDKSTKNVKANGGNGLFENQETKKQKFTSIVPVLFKAFGNTFIFGSLLKLIPDTLSFVSPQILDLLIEYTGSNQETWKGCAYAVLLFLSAFFATMVTVQYSHIMYLTGMKVRTALISAIYRKSLLLSNAAKRESSTGEIVNLMSVDVQKIMDLLPLINTLWSAPFQIAVALYFLWGTLGISSLVGLAVMGVLVPLNALIAGKAKRFQILQMKKKDLRVKLMGEIFAGIKVLKLYAWEPSFENQVLKIRKEEIEILRKTAYLNAVTSLIWKFAPFLVSFFTFGTYILVSNENVLDSRVAFVSLSLFNIMSLPLTFLPMIIVLIVQAIVSIKRLNKFMNAEEILQDAVTHDKNEVGPIVIENGSFAWHQETVVLRDINLKIKTGALVAIVGSVGSGKSTLLAAMLGETIKISGRVNTKGSIAYVAQLSWIQNASLRNNILFGKPYNQSKYDGIVKLCALQPDFEILPAGDITEIGEKGINLSGGQKQRVSLARAVYNNADVYLFDDPLSAVDCHVGKHIFENVIGPNGILKKKTRVLVTHGIQYLPHVDEIVVLKNGEISERGTFKELLRNMGAFADFIRQHLETDNSDIDELDDESIIKDLQEVTGDVETVKARRRASQETGSKRKNFYSQKTISAFQSRPSLIEVSKLINQERSETKSIKLGVYLDYFRCGGWINFLGTLVTYGIYQGFSVGSNIFLSSWTSKVDNGEDANKNDFFVIYGGLGIGQVVIGLLGSFIIAAGTLKSAGTLHFRMLRRITRAPLSFFDVTPSGRIVNRFAKDVDTCDTTLPLNFRLWLNTFYGVAATIFVVSYSTPIFIAAIIPIMVLYYFFQIFYVATSRQLKRLESVTRSPIYSHFEETLNGATTIRAYSEQKRFILDSESKVDLNQVSYYSSIIANRWLQVRLETIGNIIIFFAALFAVLSEDSLNAALVGLSISYSLQITVVLNKLVRNTSDVETNIVAVERVKEYSEVVQEADWQKDEMKPPENWPENGQVEFNQYETRYRPGLDLVLKNMTCVIQPGEKVGIVGRTGAGKSSLTLALFRIVEASGGSITIDGRDISPLGLHDVRGRLTIIPQDPALFSGSLRINLDPFEQQTDEAIWHALELSHLKPYISSLPAGLEYEVAEGGENLSVGQRQLVCLARALLRKTKILVLDEATAAVDLGTDELIQQTIRSEFKDSTVITIAHRLNTIMDSNKVMVLARGEIREFDSPAKLLENKDSIFSGMARDAGLN